MGGTNVVYGTDLKLVKIIHKNGKIIITLPSISTRYINILALLIFLPFLLVSAITCNLLLHYTS